MICNLTRLDAVTISHHLRAKDRQEVLASTALASIEAWANAVYAQSQVSGCVRDLDGPVAMGGAVIFPQGHMASTWFVATPRVTEPKMAIQSHRMALQLHHDLEGRGVKRCMAWVMESYKSSCRWLERLGYQREGRHQCWGIAGETFLSYARLAGG